VRIVPRLVSSRAAIRRAGKQLLPPMGSKVPAVGRANEAVVIFRGWLAEGSLCVDPIRWGVRN
jgi:hypothetical protein